MRPCLPASCMDASQQLACASSCVRSCSCPARNDHGCGALLNVQHWPAALVSGPAAAKGMPRGSQGCWLFLLCKGFGVSWVSSQRVT